MTIISLFQGESARIADVDLLGALGDIPSTFGKWDIILLIPSLIIMGYVYSERGKWTSILRALGAALFGLYWLTESFVYLGPEHLDVVNGIMSLGGLIFFLFICSHSLMDHMWGERTRSLEWIMRTSFIAGGLYFITEHIPVTQGALIYVVSWCTYFVLRLFGHNVSIQEGFPMEIGGGLMIPSGGPSDLTIRIVFACTAALALFLFSGAVIATRTDRKEWISWARKELERTRGSRSLFVRSKRNGIKNIMRMSDLQRKFWALAAVIPIIFVTNIFRNVAVIALVYGEEMSFYDAHNVYSKFLSLGMMIILTWILFEFLPELQENMMGLFDLLKRTRRGMIVDGRLDMKYIRKDE